MTNLTKKQSPNKSEIPWQIGLSNKQVQTGSDTLHKKQQDLEKDIREAGGNWSRLDILEAELRGITFAKEEILKEIEKHIIDDDYMSIDTKQSLKELKDKIQNENL